ncbi:Gfo/Idh/MocA family protein [Amycolatopsis sp. NPDC059027]|uniref:Gfo/Idh/MocA family protein n=1 Tax=unclassified Amycolatopsis TaxID=2618356 RepID=UPI00366F3286
MTAGPVRFGVLGCADIAARRMIPALLAEPDARLVAVASRTGEKASQFAGRFGCDAVTGYEHLLEREDVEAVYLPLPLMMHAEWIERALLAGKHVLAEKPLCADHDTAVRLFGLARERGLLLFENFMFLHHSQHAAVAELLADGVIGELRGFSSVFTIPPKPETDIRYQPGTGGGMLLDVGGYVLRAAARFLGPGLTVAGAVLRRSRRHGVVISGGILLQTPDGVPAQLTFGAEHAYRTTYELSGSSGRLGVDRAFTPPETYQPTIWIQRQDHREERTLPADHQFVNVVRLFAGAVRSGGGLEPHTTGSLNHALLVDQVTGAARVVDV